MVSSPSSMTTPQQGQVGVLLPRRRWARMLSRVCTACLVLKHHICHQPHSASGLLPYLSIWPTRIFISGLCSFLSLSRPPVAACCQADSSNFPEASRFTPQYSRKNNVIKGTPQLHKHATCSLLMPAGELHHPPQSTRPFGFHKALWNESLNRMDFCVS